MAVFLPYDSAKYMQIGVAITAAKVAVLATQDISKSDNALPVGDASDCKIFFMGDTQPVWNPYPRNVDEPKIDIFFLQKGKMNSGNI